MEIELEIEKPIFTVQIMSDFERAEWEIIEAQIQCIIDQSGLDWWVKRDLIKELVCQ